MPDQRVYWWEHQDTLLGRLVSCTKLIILMRRHQSVIVGITLGATNGKSRGEVLLTWGSALSPAILPSCPQCHQCLYWAKYGCADRGAMSFINSPQLIEFLLIGQQQYQGDLSAAIESCGYSTASKQKLYSALDDLAKRGYIEVGDWTTSVP